MRLVQKLQLKPGNNPHPPWGGNNHIQEQEKTEKLGNINFYIINQALSVKRWARSTVSMRLVTGKKTKVARHILSLKLLLLKYINEPSQHPTKPLLPSNTSTLMTTKPHLPPDPLTSSAIRFDLLL